MTPAGCGPSPIDGSWAIHSRVIDDSCQLGFQPTLGRVDIADGAVRVADRSTILVEDSSIWRGSSRETGPEPCASDGLETWELWSARDGLRGTYEALFAAGSVCRPECLVRLSLTGVPTDDPVSYANPRWPPGTFRAIPLTEGPFVVAKGTFHPIPTGEPVVLSPIFTTDPAR